MSGVRFKIRTDPIATGTSAKTLLQIVAASNHAVLVRSVSVSFQGTSNTAAPIQVDLVRQTDAGTTTTSASTIKKDPDDSAESLQTTVRDSASAEPTTTDVLFSTYVHPQTGYDVYFPRDQEIKIGGGDRLGVRVTAAASVNAIVTAGGEE
jgi:hypothetical protein